MSGGDRADSGEVSARVVVRGSDGSTRIVAGEVGELPAGVEYGPSECACGADVCDHERTGTPRRRVDRAALIGKLATKLVLTFGGRPQHCREEAEVAVDELLPLVAQAIEATADAIKPDRAYIEGLQDGYSRAARLVRSLAEEGQQQ